jgi:hypothetical protein
MVSTLLRAEVFLDLLSEAGAELLVLPVHREDGHALAAADDQMAPMARFKRAAVALQPPFELLTRHAPTE